MNGILLIALREFRQIASTRSFWLTLLIIPFAFAVGPFTQRVLSGKDTERVMIIDRTGASEAQSITERLSNDYDLQVLGELSRYVQRHHLEAADPQAAWAQQDRWYDTSDAARFRASGGLPSALAKIDRIAPRDTPKFQPPDRPYAIVATPPELAAAPDSALGTKLQDYLNPRAKDAQPVDEILLVPSTFGPSPLVRLWTRSRPNTDLVNRLQDVLTRDLHVRMLQSQGTSREIARRINDATTAIAVSMPPAGGGGREAMLVKSILPLFASYLLMMSLMLSGSWALQGTVEERSNKLLETVLACVSPRQLMYGKLLGTVAVGLSMVAVWVACGAIAGFATQGAIADFIRPALAPLTSPLTIAALIYFFVAGYIAISIIFLAIGAMSDTMREAQGYLMPVMLAILLPITLLMQAIIAGGNGVAIEVVTWVPIWTPFAVLARLGTGIPAWEVLATAVLLGVFAVIELILLGRLFRASLLAQGQRPNLREIASRIRGSD